MPTKDDLKTATTEELVQLAQQDSLPALEALVQRHQKSVYLTLMQLAPERQDQLDLTQEVLLRMCRSIKSLRNPARFKVWLNRIITNLFYDELRKRSLPVTSIDEPVFEDNDTAFDIPDVSLLPDHVAMNEELDQQIRKAIAELPEQFRTIIVLRELQGLSYEDIANLTHTQIGTVKSRLARARLRLQQALMPYLQGL